jgi:hypothetical protein
MVERDFSALLVALHDANVEFLVVGGIAAVLNGTPVHTYDVDAVHRERQKTSIFSCQSWRPWMPSTVSSPNGAFVPQERL